MACSGTSSPCITLPSTAVGSTRRRSRSACSPAMLGPTPNPHARRTQARGPRLEPARMNQDKIKINWQFTRRDAGKKFGYTRKRSTCHRHRPAVQLTILFPGPADLSRAATLSENVRRCSASAREHAARSSDNWKHPCSCPVALENESTQLARFSMAERAAKLTRRSHYLWLEQVEYTDAFPEAQQELADDG